jgi:hypothetical protein
MDAHGFGRYPERAEVVDLLDESFVIAVDLERAWW